MRGMFALVLVTFAVRMSWVDVDEQVGNGRKLDSLYVELNNKQQQHKKVGGWSCSRERGALVHASARIQACACQWLQSGLIVLVAH